jgi:hypothetical protein
MLRLDTTLAADDSASFAPTDDIVLQAKYNPLAAPTIAIMTRNDAAADWQVLTLWHPNSQPVIKVGSGTNVLLRMTKNIAGSQLRVWDDA